MYFPVSPGMIAGLLQGLKALRDLVKMMSQVNPKKYSEAMLLSTYMHVSQ